MLFTSLLREKVGQSCSFLLSFLHLIAAAVIGKNFSMLMRGKQGKVSSFPFELCIHKRGKKGVLVPLM